MSNQHDFLVTKNIFYVLKKGSKEKTLVLML